MEIKSVYEFAWLTTQQIVVTADEKGEKIMGFGSGFFFHYRDHLFFITADHVSHPKDFDEGIRIGKDNFVWVFNNKTSSTELSTMLTPIGGLYSFNLYDVNDELSFEIPDMIDISFAMLPNNFKYPFLSHELCNEQVVVPAGKEKLVIKYECVAELTESDYCLVEGCVMWDIIDGVRVFRCNAVHEDLTLAKIDNEGDYILKYPGPIDEEKWKGLSGSPVFSDSCRLIGMIIKVYPNDSTVRVVPMKKITNLMDYAITYEQSLNH